MERFILYGLRASIDICMGNTENSSVKNQNIAVKENEPEILGVFYADHPIPRSQLVCDREYFFKGIQCVTYWILILMSKIFSLLNTHTHTR